MKVIVRKEDPEIKEREYPYLGISSTKTIVLFNKLNEGICLESPAYDMGYVTDHWIEADFEPFPGEIVLSNE